MRYPTITQGKLRELVIEFAESGPRDPSTEVVEQNVRQDGLLPDFEALASTIDRLKDEFVASGATDRDLLEGRIAGLVHDTLRELPVPVLDDPGFWSFVSLAHFWPFITWRQESAFRSGDPARYAKYADGTNATECVMLRTFLRGQIAQTEEGYALASALDRAADLWRSHIIRVSTGSAPIVARSFIHDQVRDRMSVREVRGFARRLNRAATNIVFPYLEEADADRMIERLRDPVDMTTLPLEIGAANGLAVDFERVGQSLTKVITTGSAVSTATYAEAVDSGDPLGDWWLSYLSGLEMDAGTGQGQLNVVDLFCGSGGFSAGLKQLASELGFDPKIIGAVDHDPEALAVYDTNHPTDMTFAGSVTSLVDYRIRGARQSASFRYPPEIVQDGWGPLRGSVDVLLAGPPCQGHSNLNNHSRRVDKRNELYLTVPAMAVALDVPIVIIENVPAVVNDDLGVVESTVRLLTDAGYTVETGVLHAARMGWAQSRDRFFLVGRRDRSPIPLSQIEIALASNPRPVSWVLGGYEDPDPSDHMSRLPELSEANRRRIDWLFDRDEYELGLTERPESHRSGTSYMSVYGRMRPDLPAQTVTTGFMTPGRGRYVHPTRRRVITPREAARLQGFPDTYSFRPRPGEDPSARLLAKWIGDAVPLPLGFAAALSALGPGGIMR